MIEKLRSIAIFATVVDQGSFRAAALHLGLAPSRVSEIVSELERELGVTLLYRTTRQLSLTHEGRLLHEKAQDMLNAAEIGLDAINLLSKEPTGSLRVTAPAFVTQTALMNTFSKFAGDYPGVNLNFHFSDHPQDLIKDGFDVAIRAGWLADSEFLTRKIGQVDRLLVGSPDYFASKPPPETPEDLEDCDWVRFVMRPDETELTSASGKTASVTGKSHIAVNTAEALYEFATRGLGLTVIPEHLACLGFQRGDLVHVLPDWSPRPLGLHAVWPDHSRRENLTTLFVRFLADQNTDGRQDED